MIGPEHQDEVKPVQPTLDAQERQETKSEGSWLGLFSSLRPTAAKGAEHEKVKMGRKELPPAGTYKSGEARADYVKVSPAIHMIAIVG